MAIVQDNIVIQSSISPTQSNSRPNPPSLQSGDRLSCPEFEHRYGADPKVRRAELIEGIVYVASPLRHEYHGKPHSRVITWLGVYQAMTPGVDLSVEPTVRLDLNNELQPDVVLFIEANAGGQTRMSQDGYIEGAPELIVEIAASSAAIDTGSKKRVYRRSGVLEYMIWQSYENHLEWFELVNGDYQRLLPDLDGIIRSQIFPGLWLAAEALVNNQMVQVLDVLQAGVQSMEHRAFVKGLGLNE